MEPKVTKISATVKMVNLHEPYKNKAIRLQIVVNIKKEQLQAGINLLSRYSNQR